MKETFLRPPRSRGEWVADALRILAVAGIAAAAIVFAPTDAGVLAFCLPALMLTRAVGARVGFDIACGAVVLVAGWSNVLDLYRTIAGWDIAVHLACTGVLAALALLVLVRARVVADPRSPRTLHRTPLVLTTTIGLAISALWEMVEWIGWRYISDDIFVAYEDTIGDMVAGALGALVVGLVITRVRLDRDDALPLP